jgi:23S rRNA pseudouridine1911/1915/1917 synthase
MCGVSGHPRGTRPTALRDAVIVRAGIETGSDKLKLATFFVKYFYCLHSGLSLSLKFFMDMQILYEDNHVLAINKPAGMLVQGDYSGERTILDVVKSYLKEKYQKPGNVFVGIVHRLDRQVSGALVLARTSKAASRLSMQFREKSVRKIYCALVECQNRLEESDIGKWITLRHFLRRDRDISHAEAARPNEQNAELRYCLIAHEDSHACLVIDLITGKKHQIRAQLAAAGFTIVGDVKYGSRVKLDNGSICLHSLYVSLYHPTKKEKLEIFAPIPSFFVSRAQNFFNVGKLSINELRHLCNGTTAVGNYSS